MAWEATLASGATTGMTNLANTAFCGVAHGVMAGASNCIRLLDSVIILLIIEVSASVSVVSWLSPAARLCLVSFFSSGTHSVQNFFSNAFQSGSLSLRNFETFVLLLVLPFLTQCSLVKCAIFVRYNAVAHATQRQPFVNSLGMKVVPVPGTSILMCINETQI